MSNIHIRSKYLLNTLTPFGYPPDPLIPMHLKPPEERQYVLRMLVRDAGFSTLYLPCELEWLRRFIEVCDMYQTPIRNHRYTYVTVRHGQVTSREDDQWHVDGFSMRYPHVPEQSYIWADSHPTEFLDQKIQIPSDFDPLVYNLHWYIQDVADITKKWTSKEKHIFRIDPYVIHRRPWVGVGTKRTFVRVSYVPIEIQDNTNTPNPLLPSGPYNQTDLSDSLVRYFVD